MNFALNLFFRNSVFIRKRIFSVISTNTMSANSADLSAAIQLRSIKDFTDILGRDELNGGKDILDPMAPSFQPSLQVATYRERIEMTGTPNYGGVTSTEIPNRGDFLTKLSVCFTLPVIPFTTGTYANYTSAIAHVLVKKADLTLGEAYLDKLQGDWMEAQDQLSIPDAKWVGDCLTKGRYQSNVIPGSQTDTDRTQTNPVTFTCPLPFSFSEAKNLALPLVSLPFSQLTLRVEWNTFTKCIIYDGATAPPLVHMMDAWIDAEYTKVQGPSIQLNPRYNFNTSFLRYVIRQRRYFDFEIPAGATTMQFSLDAILAPCAALLFFCREHISAENNDWFNFSHVDTVGAGSGDPIVDTIRLTCDGIDLVTESEESYYRLTEPGNKALRSPMSNQYLISFTPDFLETNQASGAVDFRRIKNTQLWLKFSGEQTACTLRVMALCYNVMEIKHGQVSFMKIF